MKYIKKFENKSTEYDSGDYAIFYYDEGDYSHHLRIKGELREFINNNICIIKNVSNDSLQWIEAIYTDIPDNIRNRFYHDGGILLTKGNILHWAKNKEDLKTIIDSDKYNL